MVIPEDMARLSWALKSKVETDVKNVHTNHSSYNCGRTITRITGSTGKDYRSETIESDRERVQCETHHVEVKAFLIRTVVEMEGGWGGLGNRSHQTSVRALNGASCHTDGLLLGRPIRVDTDVTQGVSRIRGEKKGNEPDEEGRVGGIVPGKV